MEERSRNRLILVACILGSTIVFVDGTVVNVALPSMMRDLGGGLTLQQWVVDAYLLTLGSLILIGGSLADILGERRIFTIGVISFGVTSLLCAVAPDGNTLIVFRALQGIAGALLTPAALATITSVFAGEERGAAIGTWTAWTGVGILVGPVVGGWLVSVGSWRSIFLINVPLVLVTLALVVYAFPHRDPDASRARIDFVGAGLCVLGLGGPVFALIEQPHRGWSDPLILVSLIGGLLVFAVFLLYERRAPEPMLKLELFRRRNFSFANLETLFVYAALSTFGFFLVLYLQQIVGWSALESGLALLPTTLVMFVLAPIVGRLSMRLGPRFFMGIGPLICAAGLLPLTRLGRHISYATDLLLPVLVFSVGLSLVVAPLTSTVLADAGPADAGIASGINNAVARVAALLGIAALGLVAVGPQDDLNLHGFHAAIAATSGLLAAGGVIGLAGIRNRVPT